MTDQDLCYQNSDRSLDGAQRNPGPPFPDSAALHPGYNGIFVEHADLPEIEFGERAFEIAMARQMAGGELSSTWFDRHRSKPITEIPAHWPEDYRQLVERRIALIGSDRYVGLIERPEHKRRWNQEAWETQEQRAFRAWLLDRLETGRYWPELRLQTTRSLADRAETDADFMRVAERYVGHAGFDLYPLVAKLVEDESVPFLPILRYKPSGLRKPQVWEETWRLQRLEDAIDAEVEAERTAVGCVGAERVTQGLGAGSLGYASLTQPTLENVGWVRRASAVTQQNGASYLHQRIEEEKSAERRRRSAISRHPRNTSPRISRMRPAGACGVRWMCPRSAS